MKNFDTNEFFSPLNFEDVGEEGTFYIAGSVFSQKEVDKIQFFARKYHYSPEKALHRIINEYYSLQETK